LKENKIDKRKKSIKRNSKNDIGYGEP